jgi:hypothetical protein
MLKERGEKPHHESGDTLAQAAPHPIHSNVFIAADTLKLSVDLWVKI